MTDKEIMDFHILERKKFNLLGDVFKQTEQIAESIDRTDQPTLVCFLEERQVTLYHLTELKKEMTAKIEESEEKEGDYLRLVLSGKQTNTKAEEALSKQVKDTQELLKRVIEIDKRVNLRIAGGKSVYHIM